MKSTHWILCCATLLITQITHANQTRPANWAQPIELQGTDNLHKVSDTLYRSAQPASEGMCNIKKMGIKTIVNLRSLHTDDDELKQCPLKRFHIPIRTWKLKEKHVLQFLRIALDPKHQPVLVHCQHGADRTGTMLAFYRMVKQGWSKEEAIEEMTQGGYGYHSIWKNLLTFIREADIDSYRKKLGLVQSNPAKPETKGHAENP